jgi:hypothetical protein
MTEDTSETSQISFQASIRLASENFAILSAITAIFAAAVAMTTMISYIAVFDISMIWIIEYSDLLKLFLVGVAFTSGYLYMISNLVNDFHLYYDEKGKASRNLLIFSICVPIIVLVLNLRSDVLSPLKAAKEFHLFSFTSYEVLIALIYIPFRILKNAAQLTTKMIVSMAFVILLSFGLFGRTYGLKIRDADENYHDITTKIDGGQRDVLTAAKIILITSHHTILLQNKIVIALPTSDILRITRMEAP